METLQIPEGINYECQGCGKCCSGWALPLTPADYERVSSVEWPEIIKLNPGKPLFRELTKRESEGTPYTHKIVSDNGPCPFLIDKLCHIHGQKGAEFKPAMCQLFPYSFSETPTGIYTTVSFVSVATVMNTGLPLTEQREYLEKKWEAFRRLYPDYKPDWSQIKLSVGVPLDWNQYIKIEERLLEILKETDKSIEERLWQCSAYLKSQMPTGASSPAAAAASLADAPPLNTLDKSLLAIFHKMYFPSRPLKYGEGDFSAMRLVGERFLGGKRLHLPGQSFKIEELQKIPFCHDAEVDNLLYRYVLSHIFGKKYFGAGFGQVSVLSGFHHIVLMITLIKLHSRALSVARGVAAPSMIDVAATVRQLERQVGETKLGGYSAAAWEMMLGPATRARRLLANC